MDFFQRLNRCYHPKLFDNGGQYLLLFVGKYSYYCERPPTDDPIKTLRDIGSHKRYSDKYKTDFIGAAYNGDYKTHYARYIKITTTQFEQWSRFAVELREQAEYERLL